jgi:hypothetical protein
MISHWNSKQGGFLFLVLTSPKVCIINILSTNQDTSNSSDQTHLIQIVPSKLVTILRACLVVTIVCLSFGDYCLPVFWWLLFACLLVTIVYLSFGDYCLPVLWWLLFTCLVLTIVCLSFGDYCLPVFWWLLFAWCCIIDCLNIVTNFDGTICMRCVWSDELDVSWFVLKMFISF